MKICAVMPIFTHFGIAFLVSVAVTADMDSRTSHCLLAGALCTVLRLPIASVAGSSYINDRPHPSYHATGSARLTAQGRRLQCRHAFDPCVTIIVHFVFASM